MFGILMPSFSSNLDHYMIYINCVSPWAPDLSYAKVCKSVHFSFTPFPPNRPISPHVLCLFVYSTALSSNLAGLFSPADGSAFLLCSFSEELLALLADFSPESLLDEDEVESPSPFSLEDPLDTSLLKEGLGKEKNQWWLYNLRPRVSTILLISISTSEKKL